MAQLERIERLESTLARLQHSRFGASSERSPDQGVSNKSFPEELPRIEVHHGLEGEHALCSCGEALREIGTEESEQLAVVPCRYYVMRHICLRYGYLV